MGLLFASLIVWACVDSPTSHCPEQPQPGKQPALAELDRAGGLRLVFELSSPSDEDHGAQMTVVRAIRARLGAADVGTTRVYWQDHREVVVDVAGPVDSETIRQIKSVGEGPDLPPLTFTVESTIGPSQSAGEH